MKTSLVIFVVLFSSISCRDSDFEGESAGGKLCGVSDPLTDLDWLREEVEQIKTQDHEAMDVFVYSARYGGNTVFFVDICCPVCNVAPPEVRNCQGQSLGRLGDGIPADEVVNRSLIWSTENGVCTRD